MSLCNFEPHCAFSLFTIMFSYCFHINPISARSQKQKLLSHGRFSYHKVFFVKLTLSHWLGLTDWISFHLSPVGEQQPHRWGVRGKRCFLYMSHSLLDDGIFFFQLVITRIPKCCSWSLKKCLNLNGTMAFRGYWRPVLLHTCQMRLKRHQAWCCVVKRLKYTSIPFIRWG